MSSSLGLGEALSAWAETFCKNYLEVYLAKCYKLKTGSSYNFFFKQACFNSIPRLFYFTKRKKKHYTHTHIYIWLSFCLLELNLYNISTISEGIKIRVFIAVRKNVNGINGMVNKAL